MKMKAEGKKKWMIPDGYIPGDSSGKLLSHESICALNTSGEDAHLEISIYFEDREPLTGIHETVPAARTRHIRTASLSSEGAAIPVGVPYAIVVESDVPIVVQYSRLDTTQKELALMSVIAYPL